MYHSASRLSGACQSGINRRYRVLATQHMKLMMAASRPRWLGGNAAGNSWEMVMPLMASRTKRYQIVQDVVAELAPLCQMMHLQVFRRTTILTAPPIAFEHSVAK
jgi:hypothetical protein